MFKRCNDLKYIPIRKLLNPLKITQLKAEKKGGEIKIGKVKERYKNYRLQIPWCMRLSMITDHNSHF